MATEEEIARQHARERLQRRLENERMSAASASSAARQQRHREGRPSSESRRPSRRNAGKIPHREQSGQPSSAQAVVSNVWGAVRNGLILAGRAIARFFQGLVERFGMRNTLIGCAVAVAVIVLLIVVPRGCAASQSVSEEPVLQGQEEPAEQSVEVIVNQDDLAMLLGAEDAQKLLDAASADPDVAWIANHYEDYATDGAAVQGKILNLAANEPAAVSFVRNWPDRYPENEGTAPDTDYATYSASAGVDVPRFYQWDEHWGYTVYSSTSFAVTGCCPTSMAMVYQGLTGDTSKTPYDMAQLASAGGYESTYSGTDGSFLEGSASELGLSCHQIGISRSELEQAFSDGELVVVNVGPGDFTSGGHFFVALGLNDDGQLVINDPYSEVRSNKTWDVDTVLNQTIALYAFSKV